MGGPADALPQHAPHQHPAGHKLHTPQRAGARPTCVRCWRMNRRILCSPSPGSLLSLKMTCGCCEVVVGQGGGSVQAKVGHHACMRAALLGTTAPLPRSSLPLLPSHHNRNGATPSQLTARCCHSGSQASFCSRKRRRCVLSRDMKPVPAGGGGSTDRCRSWFMPRDGSSESWLVHAGGWTS